MYRGIIAIILLIIPHNCALLLPSIFWDPSNPILGKQFWNKKAPIRIFDTLTFICPNHKVQFKSANSRTTVNKYVNLYMKEVPAVDITNFDGMCDTTDNSTFFIANCYDPMKFVFHDIDINVQTAKRNAPVVKQGGHYMLFATSNGTRESINTTSKECTLVFRIYVHPIEANISDPSPLYGRENVCENHESTRLTPKVCKDIIPQNVNVTTTNATSITVTWQPPPNSSCSITKYTVCYRQSTTASCKTSLVPRKMHSVTLRGLTTDQTYFIKVRAHTTGGIGDYCKEISFKTGGTIDTSAQKDEQKTDFDGKSIGMGFAAGVVFMLILLVVVKVIYARLWAMRTKKECCSYDEQSASQVNNPTFRKTSKESVTDGIQLNTGYRQSVQGWKLPPVTEENLQLYQSDA